jgi:hypothetical protein
MPEMSAALDPPRDAPAPRAWIPIALDQKQHAMSCPQGEDDWENEGGQIARPSPVTVPPAPFRDDIERLQVQVSLMEVALSNDLVEGRMGIRHNTYAHRSRVLRQQRCRLDAMRASDASDEKGFAA